MKYLIIALIAFSAGRSMEYVQAYELTKSGHAEDCLSWNENIITELAWYKEKIECGDYK